MVILANFIFYEVVIKLAFIIVIYSQHCYYHYHYDVILITINIMIIIYIINAIMDTIYAYFNINY